MATHIRDGDQGAPGARTTERHGLPQVCWRDISGRVVDVVEARRARPWLAMVAAPLAIVAAVDSSAWWWLVPVCALMWWWAPRGGWHWRSAVQEGCVGVEWSIIGAYSLAAWPDRRLTAAAWWIAAALALAAIGLVNRRRAASGPRS